MLSAEATDHVQARIENIYAQRNENFGNAREMRTLFEATVQQQANRLTLEANLSAIQLQVLEATDINSRACDGWCWNCAKSEF